MARSGYGHVVFSVWALSRPALQMLFARWVLHATIPVPADTVHGDTLSLGGYCGVSNPINGGQAQCAICHLFLGFCLVGPAALDFPEGSTPSGPPCGNQFARFARWRISSLRVGVPAPSGGGGRQGGRGPRALGGYESASTENASAAHRPTPAVPTQTPRSVPPAGLGRRGTFRAGLGRAPRVVPVPHRTQKGHEDDRQGGGPEGDPLTALGRGARPWETRVRPTALRVAHRRPQKSTVAQSSSWFLWVSCPKSGSSSSMWASS